MVFKNKTNTKYRLIELIYKILNEKNSIDKNKHLNEIKELELNHENIDQSENKDICYLLKQSTDVASILNTLNIQEKDELLEIDNLRNYFPNEDIYDGDGHINCIINNTNIMIECKNYSQTTINKTFSNVYERCRDNFKQNEKFHFGILAFSHANGIPIKLPNGKYIYSKNNNIEMQFIENRFILIIPNSLENKSQNLIWGILIGIKMYKHILINKNHTNTKYKFKKAQKFLEGFKKKIVYNTKLLKSIHESLYESINEIDELLKCFIL